MKNSKSSEQETVGDGLGTPDAVEEVGATGATSCRSEGRVMRHWQRWNRFQRVLAATLVSLVVAALLAVGVVTGLYARGSRDLRARIKAEKTLTFEGHTYRLNDDVVSFMLLGYDGKKQSKGHPGQLDAIVIIALNTASGKVKAISVPRDSMVEDVPVLLNGTKVSERDAQLCLAYAYGGGDELGVYVTSEVMSQLLAGVRVRSYYMLNYKGLPPMNDAMGGVTLTPLESIPETDIVQGQEITLKGQDVERYVRWRNHSAYTASLDRQARQVHYLKELASDLSQKVKANPKVALDMLSAGKPYMRTNLSTAEWTYILGTAIGLDFSSLEMETLPGTMGNDGTYAQFHVDKDAAERIVLDAFYTRVN